MLLGELSRGGVPETQEFVLELRVLVALGEENLLQFGVFFLLQRGGLTELNLTFFWSRIEKTFW